MGGTGKTPLVAYLCKSAVKGGKDVNILSRGYKRKTSGYLKVKKDSTVEEVGDEPLQLYNEIGQLASVHVCENRPLGVKEIIANQPATQQIILDDAFQHLAIKPALSILLTPYYQPFIRIMSFLWGDYAKPGIAASMPILSS